MYEDELVASKNSDVASYATPRHELRGNFMQNFARFWSKTIYTYIDDDTRMRETILVNNDTRKTKVQLDTL